MHREFFPHDVYGNLPSVRHRTPTMYMDLQCLLRRGNPYTSFYLATTMYMDFPFVKCIGNPYVSFYRATTMYMDFTLRKRHWKNHIHRPKNHIHRESRLPRCIWISLRKSHWRSICIVSFFPTMYMEISRRSATEPPRCIWISNAFYEGEIHIHRFT